MSAFISDDTFLRPETEKRVVITIEYTAHAEMLDVQGVIDKARESGSAHVVDMRVASADLPLGGVAQRDLTRSSHTPTAQPAHTVDLSHAHHHTEGDTLGVQDEADRFLATVGCCGSPVSHREP